VGKFDDALKKAEAAKGRTLDETAASKVVKIPSEEIEALRLETGELDPSQTRQPFFSGKIDPRLVCLREPSSPVAECFRVLRARILSGGPGHGIRSIMVTSPQPSDGKSTSAANLAITIAGGINEYVLLADCDLRNPSLHQIFGLHSNSGIREYLEEGTSIAPFLKTTQVNKLTLLPAGKPPLNPSELLSSEKMRRLIEELKGRYQDRYIIIDGTPAGFAAETHFLSTMVDGVLLVVRSGKTDKNSITEAVEHIGREKIIGVVFNASNENRKKYRHYYRYYQKGKA
jgi:exopolysaccharide/PEP-CTERM locus tyrosine autokinase